MKLNYVDLMKGEYVTEAAKQDGDKKNKLKTMKDVYIVSLINNQSENDRKGVVHMDATKTIKVRTEERKIVEKEDRLNRGATDKNEEVLFKTWQEQSLELAYKPVDKKYKLIEKNEIDLETKITRVELMIKKTEKIKWSGVRAMDYYLYCEKGITEGVFIKVDVRAVVDCRE